MSRPLDIATAETMEFLLRVLPDPGARVLEVGCGAGDVALSLMQVGYEVVAVDADEDAVRAAQLADVDARLATFPAETPEGPFDAVVFTRSLHHIAPLAPVYDRVRSLLADGGRLVVEDWAWNRVDTPTAAWGQRMMELGLEIGLSEVDPWVLAEDPHDAWHQEHGHHGLHFGETMWAGARPRFEVTELERAPYFYRYFCGRLPQTEEAGRLAERILAMERTMIAEEQIVALGMRFTGTPR